MALPSLALFRKPREPSPVRCLLTLNVLCLLPGMLLSVLLAPTSAAAQETGPVVLILESEDPSVLAPELRQAFVAAGLEVISPMAPNADQASATLSLYVEAGARDVRLRLRTRGGNEEGGYLRAGRRAQRRGRWMIRPIQELVGRTLAEESRRGEEGSTDLLDPWDAPRDPSVVVVERVPLTEMMDPWNHLRGDSPFANVPILREVLDPWDGHEELEGPIDDFDTPFLSDLVDPWLHLRPSAADLSPPPTSGRRH